MNDIVINRLSRLVAILTILQTRRLITSASLAEKFGVSTRTIYRDLKTLDQAGVPILTEDGKGYSLMEGYKIPPVMFTENQANALIIAEQLVLKNRDSSLIKDYADAIDKVKAVLRQSEKDKVNLLSLRTKFDKLKDFEINSNNLSALQNALTNFYLIKLDYINAESKKSERIVEPFALLNTRESWLLVAYCRLRAEFRFFRLDRIKKLEILSDNFIPHKMTLQEFFEKYHEH
ncbi:helix-turn-helix transcriptional regulator [Chryseobacterium sp. SIMBA_038]|uniref:helix-turn-helix transcriptional regulator n=1 Tax=Chryseobacterium sp. SIMBA_038 TaxID=3085780 RepID=UPI0039793275